MARIYLLLNELEVRTVSYRPSFSARIYGPSANRAGHKSEQQKRGSVTYSTDRENEVSKIFISGFKEQIFEFSGPYSRVRPDKLTNDSARAN